MRAWRGTGVKAVCAAILAALSVWLLGCGESGAPADSVALKRGGELAAWSPSGSLIAAPGTDEITLLRPDGSVSRQLRAPGVIFATWPCECDVGWSRDGDRVLFVTRRSAADGGGSTVGSLGADGGRSQRAALDIPISDAAWSPGGWPLVFVSGITSTSRKGPEHDLWRLDRLGGRPHRLLAQPGTELRPQISPDGTEVLYLRQDRGGWRTPWVVGVDGSDPHPVGPRLYLATAAWAPDGKRVAIVGGVRGTGLRSRLYVASARGGGLRRIGAAEGAAPAIAWSPNGHWIAYGDFEGKIWRVRPDGTGLEQLGRIRHHQIRRLVYSPNSAYLAYTALKIEEYD